MFYISSEAKKKLATTILVLSVIGSFIAGIWLCCITERYGNHPYLGQGVLTIIVGSFSGWLVSLPIYAVGELEEKTDERIKHVLTRLESGNHSASIMNGSDASATPKKICPHCGARNNVSNKTCFACNEEF